MVPLDWSEIIPPREWRKILSKIRRLEKLKKQIDRDYARERFAGIEEKEVEAERLEEELSALYDLYSDASDAPWNVGEGYSLDEILIMTYLHPEAFSDRESWIGNMKENIRLLVQPYDPSRIIPDDLVLSIAEEAVKERKALIERYERGVGKGKRLR